jgi:hypothetical protein
LYKFLQFSTNFLLSLHLNCIRKCNAWLMLNNTEYNLITIACTSWQAELKTLQDSVDIVSSVPTGNIINVVRGSEFDCFKRAVSRKTFNPFRRLDIQFVDVDNQSEGAVDNGGPMREFFRVLLGNLFDGSLFEGPETGKQLCLSTLG